jgi:hypothetical protein
MALADLIKAPSNVLKASAGPPSLNVAAASVAKLERQLRLDRDEESRARDLYSTLLVDACEGRAVPDLDLCGRTAAAAAAKLAATEEALAKARSRLAMAEAAAARDNEAKAWDRVEKANADRAAAFAAIQAACSQLAKAAAQHTSATTNLVQALPGAPPDPDGAALRAGVLETAIVIELARQGLNLGCDLSPSTLYSTPNLEKRFAAATQVVATWKGKP